MQRYRKRPVVIEAIQYTALSGPDNGEDIYRFICDHMGIDEIEIKTCSPPIYVIPTLEGAMSLMPGDWLIKGVEGELYPCKDSIFRATYELAETDDASPTKPMRDRMATKGGTVGADDNR